MNSKVTYRQQFTRCGKDRCRKCREGEGHGPYWYAYWSEKGRTVSKYIGSHLPADLAAERLTAGDDTSAATSGRSAQQTPDPILRIYLLGQFRLERKVEREWRAVDSRTWHRRRARALLGCLLSNSGRRLGREQVMNLLWPDLDPDIAANRLNGAVHELRQILEPDITRPATSRLLRLERDVLILADSTQIWVDAEEFENLLREADTEMDTNRVKPLLEAAANLYQGSYLLEELYSEWATRRRDALQRAWAGLLLKLSQIFVERKEFVNAIETLDRLRSTDPGNETALQRLMILLTQLDRRGEALQVYQRYAEMLQRDDESDPLPETVELYEKLCRGSIPALPSTNTTQTGTRGVLQPVVETEQPARKNTSDIAFTRPTFQIGRHNQSPLIGREREQQTLHQVLEAIEGVPGTSLQSAETRKQGPRDLSAVSILSPEHIHFLLLKGEPGIGKTRLAEELSLEAYARGWTVAWSRSYEQESSIPYHPWTEMLRTLFQSTSTFVELMQSMIAANETTSVFPGSSALKIERLGALLPDLNVHALTTHPKLLPSFSHEQERLHLWEATLALIETCSKVQPLLLVLDDLHWADDSSIELLTYLVHHLSNRRILILGTCRDSEIAPQHRLRSLIADLRREQPLVALSVQPLTQSQIGSMVSHLSGEVVHSIQTQAAGNPFFAEELARHVSATQEDEDPFEDIGLDEQQLLDLSHPFSGKETRKASVERGPKPSESLLPEAIAAVLERRLNRLSNECQSLLGKAAVLGGSFELSQLKPMTGDQHEDSILDLLEEALHAGLLTEEGTGAHITYYFWHPLIISHLYGRLSAARRALLHRKAAEAIKATSSEKAAATVVYHLNKGGGDPAQVAHYAEIAGNQAYVLAAYAEAQQYYIQVLQALTHHARETLVGTDIHKQIQHLLAKGIVQLPFAKPLHACRTLERIADCSVILGNFEDGRRCYENILRLRATEHFQRVIYPSMKNDEQKRVEAQIQALLWREIGKTWSATGDYERAYDCYQTGKDGMTQAGINNGAAWACLHIEYGAMLRLDGSYHEARRYLQEALEMLQEVVQHHSQAGDDRNIQKKYLHEPKRDMPPPADDDLNATSRATPPTRIERALKGDPLEIGYAHERLGIVAASLGENNLALEHLQTALAIYEQSEFVSVMARVYGNLGAVSITKGEHDVAEKYLRRSLDLAQRGGDLPNMTFVTHNLGDLAQRAGSLNEAEDWFQQSLTLAERISDRERMSSSRVALASVQVDLGNCQQAAVNIKQAIKSARAIKSLRCIRYALVGLADLHIAQFIEELLSSGLSEQDQPSVQRYLFRAQSILQRAIALEGMEVENIIEGKYLLALVYFLLDNLELAAHTAQQALQNAEGHDTPRLITRALRLLGSILARQDQPQQADSHLQHALRLSRDHNLQLDYARTLYTYGDILLQRLKQPADPTLRQQGLNYVYEAQTIFANCQATTDLKLVENTLNKFLHPQTLSI